jgi:hypothetical protein
MAWGQQGTQSSGAEKRLVGADAGFLGRLLARLPDQLFPLSRHSSGAAMKLSISRHSTLYRR